MMFGLTPAEKENMIRRGVVYARGRVLLLASSLDTRAVRTKPNTPPVRDKEHQAKHRKRKAAKAARRRNR